MYVCLWSRDWSTGEGPGPEALAVLLEAAPRVTVGERGVIWAEGPVRWPGAAGAKDRGWSRAASRADGSVPAPTAGAAESVRLVRAAGAVRAVRAAALLAETLLERLAGLGIGAQAGVSAVPVAAELAARAAGDAQLAGRAADRSGCRPRPTPSLPFTPAARRACSSRPARGGAVPGDAGETPAPVSGQVQSQVQDQARTRPGRAVAVVEPGRERSFLAPLPLSLLVEDERLLALLEGVGVETCGALAALAREAVEVRLGAEAVALWRLARADDSRRLFRPIPRQHPHASLEFVDYVLTDPARLVFTANALLASVCEALHRRGEHARRLALVLELANGSEWRQSLRASRPTASRETWLRRLRDLLDRLTLPDAVAGMRLEVEATEPAAVRQGDLFDPGFESAAAVEAAVARLVEAHGEVVVTPETCAHPLPERRTRWRSRSPTEVAEAGGRGGAVSRSSRKTRAGSGDIAEARGRWACGRDVGGHGAVASAAGRRWSEGHGNAARQGRPTASPASRSDPRPCPALTLQLLAEPRRVRTELARRRDHQVPVRYRDDGGWHALLTAAGPDRISGGQWDQPFAREYFRCVREDGVLLWLFRDAREGVWYLHGWWD